MDYKQVIKTFLKAAKLQRGIPLLDDIFATKWSEPRHATAADFRVAALRQSTRRSIVLKGSLDGRDIDIFVQTDDAEMVFSLADLIHLPRNEEPVDFGESLSAAKTAVTVAEQAVLAAERAAQNG